MFYETKDNHHGLAHDPFKAIVSPRPIGWIGTLSRDGVRNLAPYSFFNAISDRPKLVMFSSSGWKDSVENVKETGVFTASFVGRALIDAMNASSAPVGRRSMNSRSPPHAGTWPSRQRALRGGSAGGARMPATRPPPKGSMRAVGKLHGAGRGRRYPYPRTRRSATAVRHGFCPPRRASRLHGLRRCRRCLRAEAAGRAIGAVGRGSVCHQPFQALKEYGEPIVNLSLLMLLGTSRVLVGWGVRDRTYFSALDGYGESG